MLTRPQLDQLIIPAGGSARLPALALYPAQGLGPCEPRKPNGLPPILPQPAPPFQPPRLTRLSAICNKREGFANKSRLIE